MMTKEARRENDQYYLSQGRCPHCGGKRMVIPGRKYCDVCKATNVESKRKKLEYRKANNLCRECGKPLGEDNHATCADCRQKIRARCGKKRAKLNKKRYDELREEGRCVSCGKWAEPGRARCKECQNKYNDRIRKWDNNREKSKALRQYRLDNGLCIQCGEKLTNGFKCCDRCLGMRRDSTRKWAIKQRIKKEQANVRRNQGQSKG